MRLQDRADSQAMAYVADRREEVQIERRAGASDPIARRDAWPAMKRVFDTALALLLLLVMLPVLLLIALAIKAESRGPVLFRQSRYGRDRKPFTVLKFRTMYTGVSSDLHRQFIATLAAGGDETAGLKKLTADPRVTRVGRFLRKTSLDELPQLLNVIRGDMALVGPRPAIEYELEFYAEAHFQRFLVRPGLTGLWQVSGRSSLGFREMLELDVEYARSATLKTDAIILARTPGALVRGRAA